LIWFIIPSKPPFCNKEKLKELVFATAFPCYIYKPTKVGKFGIPIVIDFSNTAIAFKGKSDKRLKQAARLFGLMNNRTLVNLGASLGMLAFKLKLPVGLFVKGTYEQFCGGRNFKECVLTVDELWQRKVLTILDYGAEGKKSEEAFKQTAQQNKNSIAFGNANASVSTISTKITGLGSFELLEKWQSQDALSNSEEADFIEVETRLLEICQSAFDNDVQIYVDAEESWIQDTIDHLTWKMMSRFNKEKAIVFNTYQLYRKDRLVVFKKDHERARKEGIILGAKIVRGAYQDKERKRAIELNYDSPIQDTKADTDQDYNLALRYGMENLKDINLCNATHNENSCANMAKWSEELGIPSNHPHLVCCQLYGMSDNLTFNLVESGFNVAKYVPYGPVSDVIPYLIRRAKENSSVTGDMSRELGLIRREIKRRSSQ